MIATAQFYYIASFFLTVSVESLLEVAEHAVEHNKARLMRSVCLMWCGSAVVGGARGKVACLSVVQNVPVGKQRLHHRRSPQTTMNQQVFMMNLSAPFLIQFFQDQMKQVRKYLPRMYMQYVGAVRVDSGTPSISQTEPLLFFLSFLLCLQRNPQQTNTHTNRPCPTRTTSSPTSRRPPPTGSSR